MTLREDTGDVHVVDMSGGSCNVVSMPWIVELVQNSAGDASAAGDVGKGLRPDQRRANTPAKNRNQRGKKTGQ